MLKTSIRRILALVCVITLVVTNCFVLAPQVVTAAGNETPATLKSMVQDGYTVVTPETFGMLDSDVAGYAKTEVGETVSMNKLLFAANVTYTGASNGNFYYLRGSESGNSNICWMQFMKGGETIYFYNLFDYSKDSEDNQSKMYRGDSGTSGLAYGSGASNRFALKPANFGLTSFQNTELPIWITTEFVKAPWLTEGEADDLKIGIYINGKLYDYNTEDEENGTYLYVLDCKDNVYKEFVQRGATFATTSPDTDFKDTTSTMLEGYRVVTPETFGMLDSDVAGYAKTEVGETISIDKLLFAANVTYTGTANGNFYYLKGGPGNSNICWMQFMKGGETIYFYNLFDYSKDPEDNQSKMYRGDSGQGGIAYGSSASNRFALKPANFGLTSFQNTELPIWITTEFVKAPWLTEGEADDLKIGIYINGKLYDYNTEDEEEGTYLYVLDCKDNVYKEFVQRGATFATTSPVNDNGFEDVTSAMPEGYRVATPLTFNVSDSVDAKYATTEVGETISIDKLLFSANVTHTGTASGNFYYLKGGSGNSNVCWLQFIKGGDTVYLYNLFDYSKDSEDNQSKMYRGDSGASSIAYGSGTSNRFALKPASFGLTSFQKTELPIWITTEFVKAPWLTEGEADDLKIGIYINGKLYDYDTEDEEEGTYFYVLDCKDNVYKEFVQRGATFASYSPIMEPNDMGMAAGEYASETGEFKTSDLVANKIMNGTTFQTSISFKGEGGTLYYGSNDDAKAIILTSTSNGIQVKYGNKDIVLINKQNVGIDVLNSKFNLKLETEFVDDDVKLGIYVNNKYKSFNLVDAADALTATIGVKTTGDATVVIGDSTELPGPSGPGGSEETPSVDFSVMGFTEDWKQTLISTKGAVSGTNSSINRAPYTGEQSTAGIYLAMSVLSLAAVAYVLWVKRSKVSE